MKCIDVIKRLEGELPIKVNKSQIHYYDKVGLIKAERSDDDFNSRSFSEESYQKLKKIILLAHAGISLEDIHLYVEFNFNDKIIKQLQELQLIIAWLLGEVGNDTELDRPSSSEGAGGEEGEGA